MSHHQHDGMQALRDALAGFEGLFDTSTAPAVEVDEATRTVLEERAHALARSPEAEADNETASLLVLALGDERYGVDIQHVQEIERLQRLTSVPGTPAHWAGVVNLRGSMYPVLDLRRYLGLGGAAGPDAKVALVTADGIAVGLQVDDVPEVRRVPLTEIGPPVNESGGARPEVVRGVTPDMLSVLDLKTLLGEPTLTVDESA